MTADPPPATGRLTFAEMTVDDLDDMAALLGDPVVMRYYPRPKIRAEALDWIRWNEGLYRGHGFGLWVLRSRATGEFVGDCGLTPQPVDGVMEVEVGYHLRTGMQGRGFATEAAAACRDHARDRLGVDRLVAIIHPDNTPSQRVAERIGLSFERATTSESGDPVHVYAARLA
ncbi:GNAT family N-acetyltransferase [Micromonospora aurantiaca]|uniref:GNAT family N-acetyltransferase n=1 Tax=Micromonospora aurantiaca (nom. illeg.) TaxID=47850 RepID=A0ABQ6UD31_9ACTN|nr:GNAT family N-acetyltransferase [Micromonospora aurantiaca]KAB1108964.1 GNAT family N-acetyltransferase [Micromonospora aurantiaca]UFN92821.1 GNAT family N-acetyltransferase [Micromonospora aurantiaca]